MTAASESHRGLIWHNSKENAVDDQHGSRKKASPQHTSFPSGTLRHILVQRNHPLIKFKTTTVIMAIGMDRIKDIAFLVRANFLPRAAISAGNCTKPTVTHVIMRAVTANRLTPYSSNSPPIM